MGKRFLSFSVGLSTLGFMIGLPGAAAAAWPTDPLVNVPLCTAPGATYNPVAVADGAGGAIVAWWDNRSGDPGNWDIYAQHVLAAGTVDPAWPKNGRAVCAAAGTQQYPAIVADGAGGAIISWEDFRTDTSFDIYAQHVLASGIVDPVWPADGRALCTAANDQQSARMAADGAHGAIVTWHDPRNGIDNYDIYAQHVLAGGAVDPLWPVDGRALCAAPGYQLNPAIVADGLHGAIVTWWDDRGGGPFDWDIYAEHVLAGGGVDPVWPPNGRALCTAAFSQEYPAIIGDGAGGAIVAWQDQRTGVGYDIYAQRVRAGGTVDPAWPANGRAVCTAPNDQNQPVLVTDGAGGAIIAWNDSRDGVSDVYAGRVMVNGTIDPAWPAGGRALCTPGTSRLYPVITAGLSGSAIIAWQDLRSAGFAVTSYDVYAQRVQANGVVDPAWPTDGRALSAAPLGQSLPAIVADGAGGAIAAWQDQRPDSAGIYAQRVRANGSLGGDVAGVSGAEVLAFALDPVRPNPARGSAMNVSFTLASAAAAAVELLDVTGRRVGSREVGALGAGRHTIALRQHLPPGIYLVRLRQGGNERVTRVAVLE